MTQRTFSRRRAPPQMLVPKPPIGSKRYRGRLGVTAALCLANSARGHAQGQNADAEPPRCRSCRGAVETILGRCILARSEEHTSELQSLMRISYAVFCLKKKKKKNTNDN